MEEFLKDTRSVSLSDVAHLRHRQSVPDVPEDVEDELMLHFNDPNWDFEANSSTISISTDGVEPKRWSKSSTHMGASTEPDTESHVSSWPVQDSKGDFSSEATQVQWVFLPAAIVGLIDSHLFYQGFTVSRGSGSGVEH
jgi:hypothetical protein